jgi:hypothetical protein
MGAVRADAEVLREREPAERVVRIRVQQVVEVEDIAADTSLEVRDSVDLSRRAEDGQLSTRKAAFNGRLCVANLSGRRHRPTTRPVHLRSNEAGG